MIQNNLIFLVQYFVLLQHVIAVSVNRASGQMITYSINVY